MDFKSYRGKGSLDDRRGVTIHGTHGVGFTDAPPLSFARLETIPVAVSPTLPKPQDKGAAWLKSAVFHRDDPHGTHEAYRAAHNIAKPIGNKAQAARTRELRKAARLVKPAPTTTLVWKE